MCTRAPRHLCPVFEPQPRTHPEESDPARSLSDPVHLCVPCRARSGRAQEPSPPGPETKFPCRPETPAGRGWSLPMVLKVRKSQPMSAHSKQHTFLGSRRSMKPSAVRMFSSQHWGRAGKSGRRVDTGKRRTPLSAPRKGPCPRCSCAGAQVSCPPARPGWHPAEASLQHAREDTPAPFTSGEVGSTRYSEVYISEAQSSRA